ncbi:relaxase/mobilization nuclease domain-containing protein [Acetobacter tropicalis]|uniref:relaxase/mobilization nuclease domain-containing protein n=1 Tax=Acetobacter tropicalis TaxID=104102 RepID=UPI003975A2A1
MIIKSKPISASSGSRAIFNHLVNKVEENEYISVLEGSRQNIDNCVNDAQAMNRANSVIHFIISSDEPITRQQALKMTSMLGNEFQFTEDDIMLMAEHGKERHNGTSDNKHWHFLVRANNPETEKTLNLSNAYKRQELVARTFEIENNLKLTQGRHNKYVYHNIDEKYKKLIAPLCEGDLPNSFTNDRTAQLAKREGRDLFTLKDEAKHIFNESSCWNDFKGKIAERGWTIEQGTKKPDVLILKDEKGKLIGSVSRVLGIKKDELNNMIEMPDNNIASRVMRGTSGNVSTLTADEGQAPSTPSQTSEHTPGEAQEHIPALQQTSPQPAEIGSGTDTTNEAKAEVSEGMTAEEKLAINEFNKEQNEKEKLLKESLANQKKFAEQMLEDMKKKQQPKLQPSWNDVLDDREKLLTDIIDKPHPELKSLSNKQTRNFLYKNFKDELDDFYNDRKKYLSLRKEIRELQQKDKWYHFIEKSKLSKKEKEEQEKIKKLMLMATYLVHCMMHKIGLNTVRPNPFDYLTDEQKREYEIQYKKDKLAQKLLQNSDRAKCLDSIAVLKVFENDSKLMKWKSRDEVIHAKMALKKLNIVRDVNILTLDQQGQDEFKQAQENLDIEKARKAVLDAHKREENRYLLDVRPEPEQEQNQDNDKEKSNVVEFAKNNNVKKKKSFSYGH